MHDDEGPGCQLEGVWRGESIRILNRHPCIGTESHASLFLPQFPCYGINAYESGVKSSMGI